MPLRPREINDSLSKDAIESLIRKAVKREIRRLNASLAILDHGGLTGLGDDDHTQYLLVAGTRAMTGDLDMNGSDIILDVDGDSKIDVTGDNQYSFTAGGTLIMSISTSTLQLGQTASNRILIDSANFNFRGSGGILMADGGNVTLNGGAFRLVSTGAMLIQEVAGVMRFRTGSGTRLELSDTALTGTGVVFDSAGSIIQSGGGLIDSEGGIIQSGGANIDTEGGDLDLGGGDVVFASGYTIRHDTASFGFILKAANFDIVRLDFDEIRTLFGGCTFGGNGLNTYEFNSAGTTKLDTTGAGNIIRFILGGTGAGQFELISGDAAFTAPSTAASPGPNLILKGGDSTGFIGGNLRLRPGTGSTTEGDVLLEDGAGNEIARADAVANAFIIDTRLDINNGIALGGGVAPTLGTIGGSGPGTAAQTQWVEIDIGGTPHWIPVWV